MSGRSNANRPNGLRSSDREPFVWSTLQGCAVWIRSNGVAKMITPAAEAVRGAKFLTESDKRRMLWENAAALLELQ
jgi:hypothetical protein